MKQTPGPLILIVEDEGLIVLEMMEFLAREGYTVPEPVSTGEEAVERCGESPRPDLVLMDVHLAGEIDGIEAARRIRGLNPVPVIIMTACEDGRTGARLKELAPEGYFVKPATHKDILAAVKLVLGSVDRKGSGKTGKGNLTDAGQRDQ